MSEQIRLVGGPFDGAVLDLDQFETRISVIKDAKGKLRASTPIVGAPHYSYIGDNRFVSDETPRSNRRRWVE